MKQIYIVLFSLIILSGLAGCSKPDSPKEVGSSFLEALEKEDFEQARSLATKETAQLISQLEAASEKAAKKDKTSPFTIGEIVEDGDIAYLSYQAEGKSWQLKLIKHENHWKVDVSLGSLPGTEDTLPDWAKGEINEIGASLNEAFREIDEAVPGQLAGKVKEEVNPSSTQTSN